VTRCHQGRPSLLFFLQGQFAAEQPSPSSPSSQSGSSTCFALSSSSCRMVTYSCERLALPRSTLTMPSEPSVFDGEWWWPKWSLSSLPLPPEPQPEDFESDPELGTNVPLPLGPRRYHKYIEEVALTEHPAQLPHYYAIHPLFDPYRETGLSTVNFSSLRHCDIQSITHKLLHLRNQFALGAVLSDADMEEMNRLLSAQGMPMNPIL
jgi:hypothetical protein